MKKAIFIFLIAMLSIFACNKEKIVEPTPSLVGTWIIDNRIIKEYMNGILENTDTEPGNGTTWDFRNDGHVVMTEPGNSPESHSYVIQPDSKVNIDGFVFEIRNLGAATVTLYIRHDYSPGNYDEVFTNLKH